ncbi:hypothetical protein ACI2KR_08685 [Pseudomonas luteola]
MEKELIERFKNFETGFPNLAYAMNDRDIAFLNKRLPDLIPYLERGEIPNARAKDFKSYLSRAAEDSYKALLTDQYYPLKEDHPLKSLYYDISIYSVSHVPSARKKIDKVVKANPELADHPIVETFNKYYQDASVLVTVSEALKEMAVKRQVKTDAEREAEAKYVPPMADKASQELVSAALTKITEESYENVKKSLIDYFESRLDTLVKKSQQEGFTYHNISPYDRSFLSKFADKDYIKRNAPYYKKADSHELIVAAATKEADHVREMFVVKNLRKLASIIDRRGGLLSVSEVGRKISIGGLEGRLCFKFKDGGSFEANNSVVFAISPLGKPFHRYPLTFHNVVRGQGEGNEKVLKMRSEEWMNKEF